MSARKPKAAPIDRSALPPVVHVSGLVVSGSNRFRLVFGRDDPVQRCVPSRPKRKGGKRDATQHNKTPSESETNKAVRARENGVRGICRGTVRTRLCAVCDPGRLEYACESATFCIVLGHKGFRLWIEKCAWRPTCVSCGFCVPFHFLSSSAPPRLPFIPWVSISLT